MGVFDLDLVDRVKDAEEAKGLNKVVKEIINEANYQLIDEYVYNYNVGLSILNNQVVGSEYR
jgi:hypothetical protein